MSRRTFCAAAASGALLGMTGCAISEMGRYPWRDYDEHVDALLISANGNDLVVLGQQFHYVFTNVPMIAKVISSSFHRQVTVRFGVFYVAANNQVSGGYVLTAPASLSAGQTEEATRLGYIRGPSGVLTLEGRLAGTRYAGTKINLDGQNTLTRSHDISVKESVDGHAPSATPLTQSGDGKLHLFQFLLVFLFLWAS
jgi:hypothetical protein